MEELDSRQLADFATALESAGIVENPTLVLKKPYKYEREYETWKAYNYPQEEDGEWDDFVTALNSDDENE